MGGRKPLNHSIYGTNENWYPPSPVHYFIIFSFIYRYAHVLSKKSSFFSRVLIEVWPSGKASVFDMEKQRFNPFHFNTIDIWL